MWKKGRSLKTQFILFICIIIVGLIGTLSTVIISMTSRFQSEQSAAFIESLKSEQNQEELLLHSGLSQKIESLAAILAQTASYPIMNYNFEQLQNLAKSVAHDPEVVFVSFYGEDEKPLTQEPEQREGIETIKKEILYEGDLLGFVEIGFSFTSIHNAVNDVSARIEKLVQQADVQKRGSIRSFVLGIMTFSAIGVVLLGFGIYLIFSHLITKPLLIVSNTARRLANFDLTVSVFTERQDEVGVLLRVINEMVRAFRELLGQVQQSGIQVTSSATELSAAAKEQEAIMDHQIDSVQRVVQLVQEISDVTAKLAQTMHQVASKSQDTVGFASSGQTELIHMGEAMHQMEDASKSISNRLQAINEKADNITTVVTTITKVADQTNLLSLNAAIEAEKAGEYGRGFTVVAREIRRLADQTAVATLDIEQMVREMQSAVSAGVMEMDKFMQEVWHSAEDVEKISAQLNRIIEQVQTLSPSFEEVNIGMEQQSGNAEKIKGAIVDLSEEMWQTAESLRESFFAIEQLNEAARGLQDQVSRFKVGQRESGS